MVDRLEELLALLENEDGDGDEREDALELALKAETAVSAAPASESEIETEEGRENDAESVILALGEDEGVPTEADGLGWMPDVRIGPPGELEEVPGADGAASDEMVENHAVGNEAAEFLWDELAAPVMGRNGTVALRKPGAGDVELPALAGPSGRAGTAAEVDSVMESMTSAEKGLEGLYKQAVQASRPAAQSLPVEQAGRSLRADEPGRTAALTVDELDRAVRRDSRRYDGGMTLF